MTTTTVEQTVTFAASLERTYRAIADSAEHSAFTGAPATLPPEEGAAFSTHAGEIEGRLLELVPNQRIVQAWRARGWPDGTYSVVRYEFFGNETETEIHLSHTGLPTEAVDHIADGWQKMYWTPLTDYLKS